MVIDHGETVRAAGYDFWLFDMDGTLLTVDEGYIHRTMERVGEALGTTFSPETSRRIWFGRDGLRDELLRTAGVDPETFWSTFHRIESPRDRAAATRLHPDARIVRHLDGPRGLVTHCQPHLTEPILDRFGLEAWFETVVCCSDDLGWKPDPRPIERAMTELDVGGGRGVMVGDSLADVEAARNAGLDAILIARDGRPPDVPADRVVRSLDRLVA